MVLKYQALIDEIKNLGSVAVAFSGGVDSTFLLYAAHEALGDKAVAFTSLSILIPERELIESKDFCKKAIFSHFLETAKDIGVKYVIEGSNLDDDSDYRPGHRAIKELGIVSPLRQCGFSKQDIRDASKEFYLPTWEKPSFACLASRIPYGDTIDEKKLKMIDQAESILLNAGFKQFRVRLHEQITRIELLPSDFPKFMKDEIRLMVDNEFKRIGFSYVTLDLKGYRTGSLNEGISQNT